MRSNGVAAFPANSQQVKVTGANVVTVSLRADAATYCLAVTNLT